MRPKKGRKALDESDSYRCANCGRVYKYRRTLLRHLEFDCVKGKKIVNDLSMKIHTCPNCGRGYKWRATRNRHLRYECEREKSFYCKFCPIAFLRPCNLRNHLKAVHKITKDSMERYLQQAEESPQGSSFPSTNEWTKKSGLIVVKDMVNRRHRSCAFFFHIWQPFLQR